MSKKFILSLFFFLILTAFLSPVSVFACYHCQDKPETKVLGRVKDSKNKPVSGAQVVIVCNHNSHNYTLIKSTSKRGLYEGIYPSSQCDDKDIVTVTASKDGATGTNTGVVKERRCERDIAIINIILVPEFGLITGALAALGSTGAFLFLKKRNS